MLAGCDTDSVVPSGRANAPLSDKMVADIQAKNMDKGSPVLIRMFKEEAEAEIWKQTKSGEFALLKTYPICRWSGELGPKIKEGDRQAPEGFYTITPGQLNPNSNYYLAFNTGYPNAFDRAWGRTGSDLMVHGDCSSRGCYAMTDEQMVEIYALARESFFGGQRSFQLQAYPFRMTAKNMARHRNSPHLAFWKNLKTGYDHFEVTKYEPKVDVCDRHYVFNAGAPENSSRPLAFNPKGKCPAFEVPKEIADLVDEKQEKDNTEMVQLASMVTAAPVRRGVDGGMNPVFLAHFSPKTDNDGRVAGDNTPVAMPTPGALPRTPNNPPAQTLPPQQAQVAAVETETTPPASQPASSAANKSGLTGLFDSIFSNGGATTMPEPVQAAPTATPAKPSRTAIAAAKSAKPAPALASAKPAAPAATLASVKQGSQPAPALRPQIKDEPSLAAVKQAPAEPQQMRTAFQSAPPAPAPNVISGAAAPLPAGNFESRWSAFR
jgi:murein L,D-transpeptidase YafK